MVDVFFSYCHKDEAIRDELETHLVMLKRQGVIQTWHDRRIVAGDEFDGQISENLESADIVLLLVSPYFLASKYCYDVELKRAMERHKANTARVIPVIVDPCDWHSAPFGKLLAMPKDGKPISKFPNMHDAFLQVTNAIRQAATTSGGGSGSVQDLSPKPEADRGPSAMLVSEKPRSSNLRIKRQFSQRDKDKFREDSFQYIATFFEQSLSELESRNESIETAFKRVDGSTFTATIYENGTSRSECAISLSGSFGGDCITYSANKSSRGNSFNNMMSIVDDGTSLGWTGSQFFGHRQGDDEQLTEAGAAEWFWAALISPLQR